MSANLATVADRLIAAYDSATTLPPITASAPEFSVADGYRVLGEIDDAPARAGMAGYWPQDRLHQPYDLAPL